MRSAPQPDALAYYITAKGYGQSAYILIANPVRFMMPNDYHIVLSFHMLLGFAVELELKAALSHSGHSQKALRAPKVRHDLWALWNMAKDDGFECLEALPLIEVLAENHKNYAFRYFSLDARYVTMEPKGTFECLHSVDKAVDQLIGASESHAKDIQDIGWTVPDEANLWRLA
jgi:hypothetical protein